MFHNYNSSMIETMQYSSIPTCTTLSKYIPPTITNQRQFRFLAYYYHNTMILLLQYKTSRANKGNDDGRRTPRILLDPCNETAPSRRHRINEVPWSIIRERDIMITPLAPPPSSGPTITHLTEKRQLASWNPPASSEGAHTARAACDTHGASSRHCETPTLPPSPPDTSL